MVKSFRHIIAICFVLIFFSSCSLNRFIPEDKYLLSNNTVRVKPSNVSFSSSDVEAYIIQKPNSSFFGTKPLLWVYYLTQNSEGKIGKWINKTIGDKPVYYSENAKDNSVIEIRNYLNNVGYFNSGISIRYETKDKKMKVHYEIHPSRPYIIDNVSYKISDTVLGSYVDEIKSTLPIQKGVIYNAFKFDDERDVITEHLKNNGYYYFTKDYIFMEVDTNFAEYKADVCININNVIDPITQEEEFHKQYYVNDIYIYPNGDVSNSQHVDTITYTYQPRHLDSKDSLNFVFSKNPKIRFRTFDNIIQIHSDNMYSLNSVSNTYKALNNLKIFNLNKIDFKPVESKNDSINLLNCNITLNRSKLNYYNIQLEGTNSSGDYGILGSITYRNKNIFRGSETFNISVKAGTQMQSVFDSEGNTSPFNTKEFGIESSIFFPKFLSPIKLSSFTIEHQPRTTLTVGYNIQIRAIYERYITTLTYGYNWMKNNYIQHILTPITLNSVKVNPTEEFKELLEDETNQRIKNQYTSHLIFGLDYTYIYNNQNIRFLKDFFYFKGNIQTSGNLISLLNNTSLIKTVDNYHELFGIRYAQYVRFNLDFRYYKYITKGNQLVTRFMLGFGIPYGNSNEMPFEKSFYGGGANGMRGWQFKELGPGTFSNPENMNIERIGDIQLELNIEYRFPIYSIIKGAIFADIGNIWTLRESETFVGGEFKFDSFYKQLAVDAGFGLRFDISFILFRLDVAAPMVDPSYPAGERWRIGDLQFKNFILNFGIGYPF